MLTELALFGLMGYGYYRHTYKDELRIQSKWSKIMAGAGIKNKEEDNKTYLITKINRATYGFNCKVNIPPGLNFEKLESLKSTIEDNLKCLCEINKSRFSSHADIKLIFKPLNNLKFNPVSTKAHELLLGFDFTGSPIKLDLNKFPHLLVGGITGQGKSRLVFIALTNLIYNHSEKEIEIYLTQIRKKDLKHFKNCKQVKWYATSINESCLMLERLDKLIEKREETIDRAGAENIEEYNKKAKQKMKYIYIFAEEFSFYMPDDSDVVTIKDYKNKALMHLKNIILTGRSVGVNVITSIQRTTADNIPPTIKSQMTRVTFAQKSKLNSDNIIEIGDAIYLQPQEAILFTNEYVKFKTPYIDKEIIEEHIKDRLSNVAIENKGQEKVCLSYKWHLPSVEEWKELKEKIPLINAPKEEIIKPIGQYQSSKGPKRKSGIISLKELKNNANA